MEPSNFNSCFAFVFFFTFLGKKIVLNCTLESTSVLNGNYISGKMFKIYKIVSKCLQSNQVYPIILKMSLAMKTAEYCRLKTF